MVPPAARPAHGHPSQPALLLGATTPREGMGHHGGVQSFPPMSQAPPRHLVKDSPCLPMASGGVFCKENKGRLVM